jgi:predicted nucleic acid-binding protein
MIYAENLVDDPRNATAQKLLGVFSADQVVVPLQSVSETLCWLIARAKLSRRHATERVQFWLTNYVPQPVTAAVMAAAMDVIAVHGLQVFDAIILACASEANAPMLLSEDMQHDFRWRGVTIVNPFLAQPHPMIKAMMA